MCVEVVVNIGVSGEIVDVVELGAEVVGLLCIEVVLLDVVGFDC